MTEKVKVTQKHIEDAAKMAGLGMWWEINPLSLAMLEETGGFHVVTDNFTTITNTEIGKVSKLSSEAQALVKAFKEGEAVSPCEVELEFVEQNFYKQFVGEGDLTAPVPQKCQPFQFPPKE